MKTLREAASQRTRLFSLARIEVKVGYMRPGGTVSLTEGYGGRGVMMTFSNFRRSLLFYKLNSPLLELAAQIFPDGGTAFSTGGPGFPGHPTGATPGNVYLKCDEFS
ncbi:hypothetical protein AVEN_90122-1 [Araneus ventricosus]|uniref:Uncharacterized protein n=1 Tax=Araneus ventricosus TaxID=182803 RepID=A0A4Y2R057_ARAVE|nr:hypothetical protein AVEN_90122-1 [Araneus ventricosus]